MKNSYRNKNTNYLEVADSNSIYILDENKKQGVWK